MTMLRVGPMPAQALRVGDNIIGPPNYAGRVTAIIGTGTMDFVDVAIDAKRFQLVHSATMLTVEREEAI